MRQQFEKLKSRLRKKRGKQPKDSVAASPSGESILRNEEAPSTSGVPIIQTNKPLPPFPGSTAPPNDLVVPPGGVTARLNEPTPRPPGVAALPNESTAHSSQLTALATETAIPPNETTDPPSTER
jgi:hypothetical protein